VLVVSVRGFCRWLVSILAVFVLVLSSGCWNSNPDRVVVTGSVTYNAEPIPVGLIRFAPQPGTEGPVSAGQIKKGKYRIDMRGGVPVGRHLVEITSYRSADGKVYENPLATTVQQIQLLPEKFNSKSDMIREIPAQNSFTLDFDLTD